jgi:signal transduction histidine kinase
LDSFFEGAGEQLRRMQAVSDAALAHLELDDLLDELLVRIREALGTDTAAFLLLDEETNELIARAARGLEEEVEAGTRIPVGKGFAGRVAAERRTVTIDDVDHANVLNPILREKGVKSLLGAPLIVGGRVVGVVHVGTLVPRTFTKTDADVLQFAADRAALAIDHGRAFEAERAVAERFRRLQSVTDVALTNLTTSALLDELVARMREVLDVDTCAILLLDESARELVATAAAGLEEEVEAGVRIPVGRGFAGRIAAEIRPVIVPDVDAADIYNPILREKGIKSLLGAPLLAQQRLLGVIHVGSLTPRTFTREEAELLQTAAERAALGLERAMVYERLIELDRVRHRFVRVVSHELRTPTTAVLGSALTLQARAGSLTRDEEDALRAILAEQAQRLATVVDQLLDLSRLETHAVEIRPERRRVRDLVEHTLAELAPDDRVRVEVAVDPALEVDADPIAVERIVSNLVANALRHGAPPVVVSAGRTDGELELVVEDAGAGVPEDVRAHVFDEFVRSAESATTPGSGLGLAIARSYAHAHGGELLLDQRADRGARFRFVLPVREVGALGIEPRPTD